MNNYKELRMHKSIKIFYSFFIILLVTSCSQEKEIKKINIQDDILTNKNSFFYVDVKNYPKKNKKLPIGIFDSGTGGLTVLDAIVNYDGYDNGSHALRAGGDGVRAGE